MHDVLKEYPYCALLRLDVISDYSSRRGRSRPISCRPIRNNAAKAENSLASESARQESRGQIFRRIPRKWVRDLKRARSREETECALGLDSSLAVNSSGIARRLQICSKTRPTANVKARVRESARVASLLIKYARKEKERQQTDW